MKLVERKYSLSQTRTGHVTFIKLSTDGGDFLSLTADPWPNMKVQVKLHSFTAYIVTNEQMM